VPWKILEVMGKNPLLMYIISGIIILALQGVLGPDIPGSLVLIYGFLIYGACLGIAYLLDRQNLIIKL